MKTKLKVLKKILKGTFILIFSTCSLFACYYFFVTKDDHLKMDYFKKTKTANSINFYDNNGEILPNNERIYINISKLSSITKERYSFSQL